MEFPIKCVNIIVGDFMFLEICDENWLFIISHTKYVDILCFFVMLFCIFLCVLIRNNALFKKQKNFLIKKISLFIASVLFLLFLLFIFLVTLNSNKFEGCVCKTAQFGVFDYKKYDDSDIPRIGLNKVIIIGDSRMELINDYKDEYKIPLNYSFIAKSGAKIDWFINEAISELSEVLINRNTKYKYHIVINMGVNDINGIKDVDSRADKYFVYYKSLALKYPSVSFYLLSVNPIEKRLLKIYWPSNGTYNDDIEQFNNEIISNVKANSNLAIDYCDSYNHIQFKTYDGLHYTKDTNQDVIDYIANKCVKYE